MQMNLYRIKLPDWREWDYTAAKNQMEALEIIEKEYTKSMFDFTKASIEYMNEIYV